MSQENSESIPSSVEILEERSLEDNLAEYAVQKTKTDEIKLVLKKQIAAKYDREGWEKDKKAIKSKLHS